MISWLFIARSVYCYSSIQEKKSIYTWLEWTTTQKYPSYALVDHFTSGSANFSYHYLADVEFRGSQCIVKLSQVAASSNNRHIPQQLSHLCCQLQLLHSAAQLASCSSCFIISSLTVEFAAQRSNRCIVQQSLHCAAAFVFSSSPCIVQHFLHCAVVFVFCSSRCIA